MTSGTVVILGRHGVNLGAGMTGGEVYVHDPEERLPLSLNEQLVAARRLELREAEPLRELVERHLRYTGSAKAQQLLDALGRGGAPTSGTSGRRRTSPPSRAPTRARRRRAETDAA